MKVYISADIEGVTGTAHWNETGKNNADYGEFRDQMTAEVGAACEGALNAGATEIWVKDAHASGRNIIASRLPQEARLIRGWSGHPFAMVQGLDETFRAMLMIGYHSRAGSDANPLAHTITGSVAHIRINDRYASEMLLHTYAASLVSVPLVFVSGDLGLCQEAESLNPSIITSAVKEGVGNSTNSIHPGVAVEGIRDGAQTALQRDVSECAIQLPQHFSIGITFRDHARAYRAGFYPGASLKDPHLVQFETDDYFEAMRLLLFVL